MTKTVWISFDLGLKGDYENFYAWLDNHKAKECGHGLATFKLSMESTVSNMIEQISRELKTTIALNPSDRLYLVYKDGQKIKGKFINGKRKAAPWEGYGESTSTHEDSGE